MELTKKQIAALRLAILECQSEAKKNPEIPELAELVAELDPVLALLYRAKAVTVEI